MASHLDFDNFSLGWGESFYNPAANRSQPEMPEMPEVREIPSKTPKNVNNKAAVQPRNNTSMKTNTFFQNLSQCAKPLFYWDKKNDLAPIEDKAPAKNYKEVDWKDKDVVMIAGGTGHLGSITITKALEQGKDVVVITRNTRRKDTEHVHYIKASEIDQISPEFWEKTMGTFSETSSFQFINTVGSPEAPEGKTLREVNVLPAAAMGQGMKKLQAEGKLENANFVNISSMAAEMLPDIEYGSTKLEAENELNKLNMKNVCHIRVHYAYSKAIEGKRLKLDNKHAYSVEQLASLPIQPIIGSGDQSLQPVFDEDVADAALNYKGGLVTANAVGPEVISQADHLKYHCEIGNKKFRPIHIPYEVAAPLSEAIPLGHFSIYAVEGLKRIDGKKVYYSPEEFEKLMGHKATTIKAVYKNAEGKTLEYPFPPIGQHAAKVIKKMAKNVSTVDLLEQV